MCNCPLEYIFNTFWSLMGTYYKSQNLDNKNSEFQWGSRNAGWQLRAHLASCPTPAMPTKMVQIVDVHDEKMVQIVDVHDEQFIRSLIWWVEINP